VTSHADLIIPRRRRESHPTRHEEDSSAKECGQTERNEDTGRERSRVDNLRNGEAESSLAGSEGCRSEECLLEYEDPGESIGE